uniref:Uncharacterized protein n=1 Tax=Chloropicon roscoffensis TaxID=1461544 RepID=A0A7S3CAR0_9CHLO
MDWSSVSGLTKSLLPTQQVELEELEQILDEGNQPRLSERGDEDEDPEGGTGSNPTASSSSQSEGSPSPAEPRSPRFYAQVHNSVSGVGKYIVEQAQRPTVVVGAVAGASVGAVIAGPLGAAAGMKSGAACVAASASVGSAVADKVYTGTTETVQTLSNLLPFKGGGKRSS